MAEILAILAFVLLSILWIYIAKERKRDLKLDGRRVKDNEYK